MSWEDDPAIASDGANKQKPGQNQKFLVFELHVYTQYACGRHCPQVQIMLGYSLPVSKYHMPIRAIFIVNASVKITLFGKMGFEDTLNSDTKGSLCTREICSGGSAV